VGTSDLLACFVAGCVLNWDGQFYAETRRRHDEVNSCIDVLLNYGGFMYIGITIPWDQFQQPEVTGITWPRLIGLGFLVLFLRRIPALLVCYKMMPAVVKNWKEAVFMGYFGPVGVGAIYYLEHTRILFLNEDSLDPSEEDLLAALTPGMWHLSSVQPALDVQGQDLVFSRLFSRPFLHRCPRPLDPGTRRRV
jgi:sodium/hydrogen antiporter